MPRLGGLEPTPILLQHFEICKMMSHILVTFKKVRSTGDFLAILQPNSQPDGTAQLATASSNFIVLFVVVGAKRMGSTIAPNAPWVFGQRKRV